ncbi:MAG: PP2C family protein-serine/threonine phosphatase [Desulfovibrionaceae bacterium]
MRILIVDDSEFIHPQLKVFLSQGGYDDLHSAMSAAQAFAFLHMDAPPAQRTPVDLVLMDIRMPEMDGVEAIRRIKADPVLHDTPIITVTADTSPETLLSAFEAGAWDYITKPINRVELLARVRSVLRLKSESDRRKAQEDRLLALNQELKAAQQRMAHELDQVAELQGLFLPRNAAQPVENGRTDAPAGAPRLVLDSLYRPSGQASGDYYDHFFLENGALRLVVADVSGHGARAAVLMAVTRTIMHLSRRFGLDLAATLELANRHLLDLVGPTPDFATVIAADLDPAAHTITWASAGHCPGLLRDAGGQCRRLEAQTPPLGIEPLTMAPETLPLPEAGSLLLFTDGFYEWEVEPGRFFSLEPFLLLAEETLDRPGSPLAELERRLRDLTRRPPAFRDDLTALWAGWSLSG